MSAVVTEFTQKELIQVAFDRAFPKGIAIETGIPSRCFLATYSLGTTFCLAPASVLPLLGSVCALVAIEQGMQPWQLVPMPALDDRHFDGWDAMKETHGIERYGQDGVRDQWTGYEIVIFPNE